VKKITKNNSPSIQYSPSDLIVFLGSHFASYMERLRIEKPDNNIEQDEKDKLLSLLAKKGLVHEDNFLIKFKEQGLSIIDIATYAKEQRIDETINAMKDLRRVTIYPTELKALASNALYTIYRLFLKKSSAHTR
jgi:uncharacterized protein